MLNRREWVRLAASAIPLSLAGCARKKSPRYQGYALIGRQNSSTLSVIDLSRFSRLKEVPLSGAPSVVLAAPNRSRAFMLSADSPRMDVLDLDSLQTLPPIALGAKPHAAGISPNQDTVWAILDSPAQLAGFDTATGARHTHVALPSPVTDIDVRGDSIALAFRDERVVGLYRPSEKRLSVSGVLKSTPHLVRLRWDGQLILAAHPDTHSITAVDAASLAPQVELPLSVAPRHFCFNNDGGQLFVTGEGMDAVVIVNPYQTEVSETILGGNAPGSMAVTAAAPNYLFVTNPQSGDVTVINVDNRRVLAQIPVGQSPSSVLVTPDNEYALVLNQRSGDVAVIRLLNIREANPSSRRNRIASLFTLIAVGAAPVSGVIVPRT